MKSTKAGTGGTNKNDSVKNGSVKNGSVKNGSVTGSQKGGISNAVEPLQVQTPASRS